MTELVYYQDQYVKELEAKVLKMEGNRILLDKTIFIPQGSSEPGDYGKINNMNIAGSKKEGNDVWNILQKQPKFDVGDTVKLELDWNKRLKAMKLHSALHLLAGVSEAKFGKRAVAGVVKGDNASLIWKEKLPEEMINQIIELSNKDVETDAEIKSYWDKEREGFRWTQINEYPPIPDGGLHVKSTKEIGKIKLLNKTVEEGKQKIEIVVE